ncbi:FHF complex subunit HOOK interacting protein 2A-like [Toxorhynchites rutilus septentrionalis]|uniref:FHF complex subunit HOOK interacting protein 2A-like n=1 Tax=Toxorhynchites rutilus septentrionalis TaxID=329112 RepID=UPI00247AE4FD|nr:FHF complex subunit HOOK interacting protein 2A-like [Toxorhynchites rutilus septentrionalis]
MFLCRKFNEIDKMLGRLSEVLQTAADVLAPPPTALQDFDYHYKQVKNFYIADKTLPKIHINDTNIPVHLEQMLQILILEEQRLDVKTCGSTEQSKSTNEERVSGNEGESLVVDPRAECLEFILSNRPIDVLVELAINDSPPGARLIILNWIRRLLSCMKSPPLGHASLFQPVQKLVDLCNGTIASPYEKEEILFLETVAGLVRKDSILINLFLKSHHHSAQMLHSWKGISATKTPVNNPLFQSTRIEYDSRRISLIIDEQTSDVGSSVHTSESVSDSQCDCEEEEHFVLFDAIVSYLDSADSTIIVRACEGILILASIPTLNRTCNAIQNSLSRFCALIADRVAIHCQQIPEDMDTGDIEDANVSWGLIPRDSEQPHFIGRYQLTSFLCWLDYCDCLMKESAVLALELGELVRSQLMVNYIEPSLLGSYAPFMLVLTAKIIKNTQSKALLDEIAHWLIGEEDIKDINGTDCLLTILIENAHENSDILLQTLQFVESLLDNPHEKILHGMIFFYINNRGYFDQNSHTIESWSDEEDNRERRRGSADDPIKSRTLAPHNILKVINHFLLLLPRHIMNDSAGICYEEYMQDASRHYQTWINKTHGFNWPVEAIWPESPLISPTEEMNSLPRSIPVPSVKPKFKPRTDPGDVQCGDSGISEESFYEGPLLRLLFSHVKQMSTQPYELNLAVIAILSKLALFPHPYLHEILLSPEIPVAPGATTLWSVMQFLTRQLLTEIPRVENFHEKISETGKRLLSNPPMYHKNCEHHAPCGHAEEEEEINDPLFESIVVLEEFCKELAAIAFVKYHHATE